jgi:hypothetical protein
MLLELIYTLLIPVVDLQGEENPYDDKHNLTDRVEQVLRNTIFFNHALAYMSEEFDHGLFR